MPMVRSFEELHRQVQTFPSLRVSVAGGDSPSVLHGLKDALDKGIAVPLLVGDKDKIAPLLEEMGFPAQVRVVHQPDPVKAAVEAAALVRDGKGDILLKGQVNTTDFVRGILDKERGLRTGRLLSNAAFFGGLPGIDRILCITDGGINIAPTLEEKVDILKNALETLHLLGNPEPRVALLAANEKVHPKMQSAVDAQALMEIFRRGEFPRCIMEGPMAMDVILDKGAAEKKDIPSHIAGEVDMILVPSMDVGNALGKTLMNLAGADMAGLVLGAAAPALITSRGDSGDSKLHSLALAALCRHNGKRAKE